MGLRIHDHLAGQAGNARGLHRSDRRKDNELCRAQARGLKAFIEELRDGACCFPEVSASALCRYLHQVIRT